MNNDVVNGMLYLAIFLLYIVGLMAINDKRWHEVMKYMSLCVGMSIVTYDFDSESMIQFFILDGYGIAVLALLTFAHLDVISIVKDGLKS